MHYLNYDTMTLLTDARKIVNFLIEWNVPLIRAEPYEFSSHLGALLGDVCLQPGLRYKTVVYPRVERLAKLFPSAATIEGLDETLRKTDVHVVLGLRNKRKAAVFRGLVECLVDAMVSCTESLQRWIGSRENRERLLQIKGFGPKSLDYLCRLLGICCVAVDRHLRTLAKLAMVELNDYQYLSRVFLIASQLLEMRASDLDVSVWRFLSAGAFAR